MRKSTGGDCKTPLVRERLNKAQMMRPPWRTMLHPETLHFIQTYANALGCPEEYVCFPLISIVSGLISSRATIEVTESWHEPASLWFAILARKGELKSTTLTYLQKSLQELETALRRDADAEVADGGAAPRFLLREDDFSIDTLRRVITDSGNSVTMLSEDLTCVYDHVNVDATLLRRRNRKLMADMYEGAALSVAKTDATQQKQAALSLNMAGFIHPKQASDLVNDDDLDPITTHLLFVHPIERDCYMDDIIPVPKYTPPLHLLYKIIVDAHQRKLLYRLNPEARELMHGYLNELIGHKKAVSDSENKRYVLSKACGQFCRLVLALHTLNCALKEAQNRHDSSENSDDCFRHVNNQWRSSIISQDSVHQARDLMNYLLDQKLILMGQGGEEVYSNSINPVGCDLKSGKWMSTHHNGFTTPASSPSSTSPLLNGHLIPHIAKSMHFGLHAQQAPLGYTIPPPAHTFSATKAALEAPLHMTHSLYKTYGDTFPFFISRNLQQNKDQIEPLNLNLTGDLMNNHYAQRSPTSESRSSHSPPSATKNANPKPGRVVGREENGSYQYDFSNLLPYGAKNIRSLLTSGYIEISASLVAGRHLMPPTRTPGTENRYKTEAAVAYLHKVASLGFGTIHRTNKRSYIFKKRNYEELGDEARLILNDIQVSEQAYRRVKLSIVDADKKNPLLAQIDLSNNNTHTNNNNNATILNRLITSSTAPPVAQPGNYNVVNTGSGDRVDVKTESAMTSTLTSPMTSPMNVEES